MENIKLQDLVYRACIFMWSREIGLLEENEDLLPRFKIFYKNLNRLWFIIFIV
jgi:hypothetical protein